MKRAILFVGVLFLSFAFFWNHYNSDPQAPSSEQVSAKGKRQKGRKAENSSPEVKVINKWMLPAILEEVSGIAYLSKDRFACVQDETGTIFIYNTGTSKIEREVPFAGAGDYEGVTLAGKTAYVVRSDGKLYEVDNIESANPKVKQYDTPLTEEHNVEGLCFDQQHNRLLLAIKGSEPGDQHYKGIYAFDLSIKKMAAVPVYKINLTDAVFKNTKAKKKESIMRPSEINVHPLTGDVYITEATNPKILVMDAKGNNKALYNLSKANFSQPEGFTFSPAGELFISNEGKKESGNILQVQIEGLL